MIDEIEERLNNEYHGYHKVRDKEYDMMLDIDCLLTLVKRQEAVVGAARTFIFTEDGDRAMIAYLQLKDLLNNPKEENSL